MPDGVHTRDSIGPEHFAQVMAACLPDAPPRVAVAVSGGADSMALTLLTHDWAKRYGVMLDALTVDHGLRAGSGAEAVKVGAVLKAHGIAHHVLTWNGGAKRGGAVQEHARRARYALMREWCLAHDVGHLLAAHHMEDQAETVLMRLRKNTGLMGLAAMAPTRDLGGVQLVRPLLSVPKARLRATLHEREVSWIEDPSNQNPVFERVRTRRLLDQLQGVGVSAERLSRVAQSCAQVRNVLETAADALIDRAACREKDVTALRIDMTYFLSAPDRVRGVALVKLLMRIGGADYPPPQAKLERLSRWMARLDVPDRDARTLSGCEVRRKGGVFLISPEVPRTHVKNAQKGQKRSN